CRPVRDRCAWQHPGEKSRRSPDPEVLRAQRRPCLRQNSDLYAQAPGRRQWLWYARTHVPAKRWREHLCGRRLRGPERNRPVLHRRSEEHTSELQSRENLVCRLLLEKRNQPRTAGLLLEAFTHTPRNLMRQEYHNRIVCYCIILGAHPHGTTTRKQRDNDYRAHDHQV